MKKTFGSSVFGSFVQDETTAWTFYSLLVTLLVGMFLMVILPFPWAIIGLAIAIIDILQALLGLKYAQDPEEGLVATKGGQIMERKNGKTIETIVWTGWFILPVWPPFFVSGRPINLSYKKWTFDAEVLSVEKVEKGSKPRQMPLMGKIFLTVAANKKDAKDFFVASNGGDIKNIEELVKDIAINRVKSFVVSYDKHPDGRKGLTALEISQQSKIISDDLNEHLNGKRAPNGTTDETRGIFSEKEFGITAKNVQFEAPLPQNIKDAMVNAGSIEYENAARLSEMEADIAGAEKYRIFGIEYPKVALDEARQDRLIRDGAVQQLVVTPSFGGSEPNTKGQAKTNPGGGSGTNTIVLTGTNIHYGKPDKKQGGN